MKRNIEHNLVNWIDGMDLSSKHFRQIEDYFIDSLCDVQAIRMNNYNYGLLPLRDIEAESNDIEIKEEGENQVTISLKRCNAITAGGCRISYNPDQSESMTIKHSFGELKKDEIQHWDIVLTVNPFNRQPSGIPDEEEMPPRHPDAVPSLNLHIMREGQINAGKLDLHHLIIGRIRSSGFKHEVNANYIPPCTHVASHSELIKYYNQFSALQGNIGRCTKIILGKILQRDRNSSIALRIQALSEEIMRFHANTYFSYTNKGLYYTPLELVDCFARFAHICQVNINFAPIIEKEELLKYFYEWSSLTPATFEEILTSTMGLKYDHNNIRGMMLQVETFLKNLSELWERLSTLEYIGQHKDNIIVSERIQQREVPSTKGEWQILD